MKKPAKNKHFSLPSKKISLHSEAIFSFPFVKLSRELILACCYNGNKRFQLQFSDVCGQKNHALYCFFKKLHTLFSVKKVKESLDNNIIFLMTKLFHQIRHQIPNFECNKLKDFVIGFGEQVRLNWAESPFHSVICELHFEENLHNM